MIEIICGYCGRAALKFPSAILRAQTYGYLPSCSFACAMASRRKNISSEAKKVAKAEYDHAYRRARLEKAGKITNLKERHGKRHAPEYEIWKSMKARCSNRHDKGYVNYGGRGISVCEQWRASFLIFLSDMGNRPSKDHSIDRIDNNGDYEPGNCRWATIVEQSNNRRNNHMVRFCGEAITISEACRRAGSIVDPGNAASRVRSGWDVERAITQPVRLSAAAQRKAAFMALHDATIAKVKSWVEGQDNLSSPDSTLDLIRPVMAEEAN